MCNKYDAKLLFTDTNSLVYEINNKNVYEQCFIKTHRKRIQGKLHEIGIYDVFQILLSFFDDKRYVLDDGIKT